MIQIEPPEYVILQVTSDDGTKTLVPCMRKVMGWSTDFMGKRRNVDAGPTEYV